MLFMLLQGEEIFLDMFEDEYRSMTVSLTKYGQFMYYSRLCVSLQM